MSISTSTRHQAAGALGTRAAELHQQFFARDLHGGDLLEPLPKPLQLPSAHGALFRDAVGTLREDVELAVVSPQLDLHALLRVPPGLVHEVLLQPVQTALLRSHGYCTGGSLLRISASTASVGTPRSITRTRCALPYCNSILPRNVRSVLLSAVLPGSTS